MPRRAAFHRRITELLNKPIQINDAGGIDTSVLQFSKAGHAAWVEYYNEIEKELRLGGEFENVRDVASKTADNGARLAALFHLFEHGETGEIHEDHATSGCLLAIWHLGEAKRLFIDDSGSSALAEKLETYLIAQAVKTSISTISRKQVMQLGPYGLRKKDKLNEAVAALEGVGRIRCTDNAIELHPALIGAAKSPTPKPWN